jgi:hypothetical protein
MNSRTLVSDATVSAASSADDAGTRADPQRVLADRVEQLYSRMWIGIVATFVIGAIATYELWDARTRDLVMFWWGLVLLVTASRAALWLGYRASGTKIADARQWLRWLAISALANGANWGFAGAVFFPSHTDEQQISSPSSSRASRPPEFPLTRRPGRSSPPTAPRSSCRSPTSWRISATACSSRSPCWCPCSILRTYSSPCA